MIICKDGCYAYSGKTAEEAYDNYIGSSDDHNSHSPPDLEWFSATEMALEMKLFPKPKVTPKVTSKVASKVAPKKVSK